MPTNFLTIAAEDLDACYAALGEPATYWPVANLINGEAITAPSDVETSDGLVTTANAIDTTQQVTLTTSPVGTTYALGTDYTVGATGVTLLAAGDISNDEALLISYTKTGSSAITTVMDFSASEFGSFLDARLVKADRVIRVRISEVAAPIVGDTITMRSALWKVTEVAPALDDLEYPLTVVPA